MNRVQEVVSNINWSACMHDEFGREGGHTREKRFYTPEPHYLE